MVPNSNYSNATEQMRSEYRRSLAIEDMARNVANHLQAWRSEYSWARYTVDYEHESYSSDRHVVRDRNRIVQQKLIGTTTFPMGVVHRTSPNARCQIC